MRSIRFRFLIAALAVLLGTALAKSQTTDAPPPPKYHHEFGMGHVMHFWAEHLDLSDAQRAQMKSILEKEHPALKPLMQQVHQTEQQLRQYEQGTYDEAKVRALAIQQAQAMVELTVQKTRIHSELFQLLTADQQAKLKTLEANHDARMHKHMSKDAAPPEE